MGTADPQVQEKASSATSDHTIALVTFDTYVTASTSFPYSHVLRDHMIFPERKERKVIGTRGIKQRMICNDRSAGHMGKKH